MENSNMRFEILKEKVRSSGIIFEKLVKREGCSVYFNKGIASTCTGRDGAYLIGESAGMISPSSLEGISYSMESAKILARILNKNSSKISRKYFMETLGIRSIRIKLIFKILKMPFMYNTFKNKYNNILKLLLETVLIIIIIFFTLYYVPVIGFLRIGKSLQSHISAEAAAHFGTFILFLEYILIFASQPLICLIRSLSQNPVK